MDCSPPGSSVLEILQEKILEWLAISFSIYIQTCGQIFIMIIRENRLMLLAVGREKDPFYNTPEVLLHKKASLLAKPGKENIAYWDIIRVY